MLEEGQEAPAFELPNQDGETVSLSDFEGQRLVLYFYPRAKTSGCTVEANEFQDNRGDFREAGVAVVGVSNDPVDRLREFADEEDLDFDLLSDEDGSVAEAYESFGTVETGGESHEIAFRNTYVIGPDGRIEHVYRGVDPADHPEEVLGDIEGTAGTA